MRTTSVDDCKIIFPETFSGGRNGRLSIIQNDGSAPFDVKRVYFIYDVPGGESRGGHAHRRLHQLIIAVSGSFTVTLDDGTRQRQVMLNRPNMALEIVPGIWRTVEDFSSGAVCLVLASEKYEEADYIRLYDEFIELKQQH